MSRDDEPIDLENHFLLNLPDEPAKKLREILSCPIPNLKDRLFIQLEGDQRHGTVYLDEVPFTARLVDLPCIVETLKTLDKKQLYKCADIAQMLVCYDEEGWRIREEKEMERTESKPNSPSKDEDKKFQWPHGITPPLKNARRRRFRKTRRRKFIESPDIEKEVKRLLRSDLDAVAVRWEVVAEEEPTVTGREEEEEARKVDDGVEQALEKLFGNISSSDGSEEVESDEDKDVESVRDQELGDISRSLQSLGGDLDEIRRRKVLVATAIKSGQIFPDEMDFVIQEEEAKIAEIEDIKGTLRTFSTK